MITLKEFIVATLTDISEALLDFEEKEAQRGRKITPFPILTSDPSKDNAIEGFLIGRVFDRNVDGSLAEKPDGKTRYEPYVVMPVEFDVAVTANTEDQVSGGVGLRVVEVFKAGVDAKETVSNTSVSRVSFRVPVQLPRPD